MSSYLGHYIFVRTVEGETVKSFSIMVGPMASLLDDYGILYKYV